MKHTHMHTQVREKKVTFLDLEDSVVVCGLDQGLSAFFFLNTKFSVDNFMPHTNN